MYIHKYYQQAVFLVEKLLKLAAGWVSIGLVDVVLFE